MELTGRGALPEEGSAEDLERKSYKFEKPARYSTKRFTGSVDGKQYYEHQLNKEVVDANKGLFSVG